MANPTAKAVHIDVPLTNYAIGIFQDTANYTGPIVPVVGVEKQSDKYRIWDREALLRNDFQRRAPGTESAGTEWALSDSSYYCDVFALHYDLDDQKAANADFDIESRIVRTLTEQLRQHIENTVFTEIFATGKWGTDQTGVAAAPAANQFWQFDHASGDVGSTVDTLSDAILKDMGKKANTVIFGATTWSKVKRSAVVKDQIKYTSAMVPTESVVASMLGVDRVYVARAIKATNDRGQTLATDFHFGAKTAWVGYLESAPSLEVATAAHVFAWTGLDGANFGAAGPNIYRFEIPEKRVVRYEVQIAYDTKIVSTSLGKFLTAAVS